MPCASAPVQPTLVPASAQDVSGCGQTLGDCGHGAGRVGRRRGRLRGLSSSTQSAHIVLEQAHTDDFAGLSRCDSAAVHRLPWSACLTRGAARAHLAFMSRPRDEFEITPDILLRAYSIGLFPMAESAEDQNLFWIDPEARGVFPLDGIIISKKLARIIRSDRFDIRIDQDFEAVIDACASTAAGREKTWINQRIKRLYGQLFDQGRVHTVEAWRDGALAGGLYGVALGAAFFGESMFHRQTDASKVALVHLAGRLAAGGFRLLDTQFVTPHLETLGAIEVSKERYRLMLAEAVALKADFWIWPKDRKISGRDVLAALPRRSAPAACREGEAAALKAEAQKPLPGGGTLGGVVVVG